MDKADSYILICFMSLLFGGIVLGISYAWAFTFHITAFFYWLASIGFFLLFLVFSKYIKRVEIYE